MTQFPTGRPTPQGSTRLVIIAAAAAVVAVVLMNVYVAQAARRASGESFTVYKVKRDLRAGQKVNEDDLQAIQVPKKDFEDAFEDAIKFNTRTNSIDRIGEEVTQQVRMNDFLRQEHFLEDERQRLVKKIPRGTRLYALPVDSETMPTINPNNYVDIYGSFAGGPRGRRELPVMKNVQVLVVGNYTVVDIAKGDVRAGRVRKIEILIRPEQAEHLMAIKNKALGPFTLLLRPQSDNTDRDSGQISQEVLELIGVQR